MNAVEIEEAVSNLAGAPFDPEEFPFAFLEAFGNKPTTLKKLQSKSSSSNQSDLPGGVLQRNNIHLKVCSEGEVTTTLTALRESPATVRYKAKFILATDGKSFEAENLADGETIACNYPDFHDHFGFFLPLAGITTVRQIRENAFDIKATARLNRLYIELLKDNPDWDQTDRREALNHFMARLIFCFFAEDTNIFHSEGLFTATVAQMSDRDSSNTHEVLSELFRSMSMPLKERKSAQIRNWANVFPYVNGGLFSASDDGSVAVPQFSKIARSYLLHVGNLDWTKINPDIFGSMIQAVADDEERGALGMHYTSVPNILKVLNPLFLDDLRSQLAAAEDNARKLLNLRQRMARIRVFDPACGSGNFLVIAYKEMRAIEAEINLRRGEPDRRSDIPLTNFRGIELRHFSCEIARLALIIAEYQCDVLYRGPKLALLEFLPLKADNWITCGNALRLDWLSLCPPTGTGVKVQREDLDLWGEMREQAEIDFENEQGEAFVCGNPPYLGGKGQSSVQKAELLNTFGSKSKIGELDYVTGWLRKGAEYVIKNNACVAFVVTNSVNQGAQVHQLWPRIFELGVEIFFAHRDFKWTNNATRNAAVICSIIGIKSRSGEVKYLFGEDIVQKVACIGPYLIPGNETIVKQALVPISGLKPMITGNSPYDGGNLMLSNQERLEILKGYPEAKCLIRMIYGSRDYLNGEQRYCLWINHGNLAVAESIPEIQQRIRRVFELRSTGGEVAQGLTSYPYRFRYTHQANNHLIIAPRVSSERRSYIPFGLLFKDCIVSDSAQAAYDAELWHLALLLSLMHMSWVRVVAGKLKTDLRYSSALCYNTFPVPTLTDQNKADLTRCAEDILLAREAHFPATIADLYNPDTMPENLRQAHDRNDETLERIYIGRRFKNDTERLEKLFELYTKMTSQQATPKKSAQRKTKGAK